MPTMSLYELKVSGLLKPGAPPGAETEFATLFAKPASTSAWSDDFVLGNTTTLKADVVLNDEHGVIPIGSTLANGSIAKAGSKLNGDDLTTDKPTGQATITKPTILKQGSLLKGGTQLVNADYAVAAWDAGVEDTAAWKQSTTPGQVEPDGTNRLLSFHGVIAVSRPGALGHHWTMQSAQDDLKWFYQYREQDWFQKLVYALIDFNTKYAANLEEKLRIRDVKWYCGNGSGP